MHKFSDVFEFHKKSKIKAGEGKPEGKYPFYTSSTELNKYVDDYLFDGKSLVFGTGGNASVHFAQNKFAVSTDCFVAQANTKDVNPKFVYYYLSGNIHILEKGFKGAGLKHISKAYISEITFPKFSRKKQDKIVQILDTADNLRQKRKEQLALLDDYLKSVFLGMFGNKKEYPRKKMSELAQNRKGSMRTGPFGSTLRHGEFVDEGIAVLGIDNAVDNEFKWKKLRYITDEKYQSLKQYTVYPGDVLITIMGTLGRSAVVPDDIPEAINTKHLACISLNTKIANSNFISYSIVNGPHVIQQLKGNTRGAIMGGLNLTIIKDLNISLPPIELQNKFADIVKQVEKTKQKMCDSLHEMDNHFNALMQRYFE
jgi:type I restriction enzyme S subunit